MARASWPGWKPVKPVSATWGMPKEDNQNWPLGIRSMWFPADDWRPQEFIREGDHRSTLATESLGPPFTPESDQLQISPVVSPGEGEGGDGSRYQSMAVPNSMTIDWPSIYRNQSISVDWLAPVSIDLSIDFPIIDSLSILYVSGIIQFNPFTSESDQCQNSPQPHKKYDITQYGELGFS